MISSVDEWPTADDDAATVNDTPTVLLLDDDSITLLALSAILERTKANVIECEHERCVVESCERRSTTIDPFVADVVLPVSNGPAIVRKVKALQPQMRLLFISGFSLSDLGKRGLLSKNELAPGNVEFLQKPFAPEIFLTTVEKLLAKPN